MTRSQLEATKPEVIEEGPVSVFEYRGHQNPAGTRAGNELENTWSVQLAQRGYEQVGAVSEEAPSGPRPWEAAPECGLTGTQNSLALLLGQEPSLGGAQGRLLACSGDPCGMPGIKPRSAACCALALFILGVKFWRYTQ